MSSTAPQGVGGAGAALSAAPQRYFCHQCDRTVSISPSPSSSELLCPHCNGGFIEEFDLPPNPNPNPNPSPIPNPFFSFDSPDPFFSPFLSSTSSSSSSTIPASDFAGLLAAISPHAAIRTTTTTTTSSSSMEPFNPLQFIQNYIQSMMGGDGANIQLVFEGGGGASPFAGNLGDYFIGPGLEQLIQQLAENDPNRYGTPPASKSAVDSLPNVKICNDLITSDDGAQCAVCKDEFEIGNEAKQMPCTHLYHKDCILPWLELHNSCPVCRFELQTDDQEYENRREVQGQEGEGGGVGLAAAVMGGGGGDGNSPRAVERRFRIQLPWPFRAVGSQAEGSNAGSGGSGSGGNGGGGSGETRQEDLD